jgi:lipopolysaccharide transport system ATP-binding protein
VTIAIKIENLSKQYRLGLVSTRTLSHDLNRWWTMNIRGKDDPYLKIGEVNDRAVKGESEYIWALRDINLEVEQGEVLGIIGKNGAGKSTLLKILSKVTAPTTGTIKTRGRIASLLEVGTGFHPEMTGRENIFINGAIMGMTKAEITRKLDEIINFAGVERYIDTPVKRYSSGMTVRLGFAVAAHLDPEILVVDEVLAVGDAEFQKKAIGKMQNISKGEGRTVLFVSHNMGSIKNLCKNGLIMNNGIISEAGEISKIIDLYFDVQSEFDNGIRHNIPKTSDGYFMSWHIEKNKEFSFSAKSDQNFTILFEFISKTEIKNCELGLVFRNNEGQIILGVNSRDYGGEFIKLDKGKHLFAFILQLPVKHGEYEVDIAIVSNSQIIDQWVSKTKLTIKNSFESVLSDRWRGLLNLKTQFKYEKAT